MFKATLAIKPMNNGQMVTTYKSGRKPFVSQMKFGKYGQKAYTWGKEMIVEANTQTCGLVGWLKTFFEEWGILGVDMSDFEIEDNGTYFEGICWGEHKNVHFWFEVEKLA